MDKKELGRKGEALARRHYEEHGYHVQAMNYRTRLGEVDVIAQRGSLYVFCEVKARSGGPYPPREAVTPAKQRRGSLKDPRRCCLFRRNCRLTLGKPAGGCASLRSLVW